MQKKKFIFFFDKTLLTQSRDMNFFAGEQGQTVDIQMN